MIGRMEANLAAMARAVGGGELADGIDDGGELSVVGAPRAHPVR